MTKPTFAAKLKAGTVASLFAITMAHPASAMAQSSDEQVIVTERQPLSQTLTDIAQRFNVSVRAAEQLTRGKTAPPLSGRFTVEEALARALAGSGLAARSSANGGFVIVNVGTAQTGQVAREPIIVIGTKQNVDVQDTAESVEVFTAERFDRENLFDIGDALARTPNVSVIAGNLAGISIRGINRLGTNGAGQGAAINVFQDGVPLARRALEFGSSSAWDIEQLEVLRGSQSTVQGRNSIAGAVVLQSKKPTFDWEAAARLRAAEFGTLQTAGAISGPIIADQLAFRVSADYQESDGFITDTFSGDRFDFRESLTLRGRLLFQPEAISGLSALLTMEYNDRLNGDQPRVISPPGDLNFDPQSRTTFEGRKDTSDFESWKAIADITYAFSDSVTLKLLGTYEDADSVIDGTQRALNQPDQLVLVVNGQEETYSAEARLEFDFDELTGFVGGYYFSNERNDDNLQTSVIGELVPFLIDPPGSTITIGSPTSRDVENFAFFTAWRYEPNESWTFDFSLRYDDERFTTQRGESTFIVDPETCLATAPGLIIGLPTTDLVTFPCEAGAPLLLPETEPLQSDSLGVLLPSGVVTYNVTQDASVFAGYRRGYRAGGTFLTRSISTTELFQVVTFDPEFLNTYEAGWRTQWLDQRLTVNGTFFYSEYQDQQISFTDDQGFRITDNAAATSLYGLELSVNFEATPELDLSASLGLLETNVDDFVVQQDNPDTPADEFLDLAGNDLDRSPSLSFNLGAGYRSQSGFFAGANVNYQSAYFSDIFNLDEATLGNGLTERVDAAAVVNAQLGYAVTDRLTITVYANNLFDEGSPESTDIGSINAALGLDDPSDNVFVFNTRQPQTFGVTIDAGF
ncbi:MAG: TonB-dependent receptor [Pseudomonadota bacterium]